MALSPWNVIGSGKFRTDAEEARRAASGEGGRTMMGPEWRRTEQERKVSAALEKVANEVGTESIDIPLDETLRRVGDWSTIVIDGERRESRSIGISKFEGRVAVPSFGESRNHSVIRLLRGPTRLVVHDVNQTARPMLEKPKTLGVVIE